MNIDKKLELANKHVDLLISKKKTEYYILKDIIYEAWAYADAMEAEYNKRKQAKAEKDAEDAKVFFEELIKSEDGSCKHTNTSLDGTWCFDCGGSVTI